jgi:uncharacterized membrane protein YjjP (DUF1212 family)
MQNVAPITDQLFTATNIASVGLATGAVTVASNALYKLARLQQRWTAFIASMVIAYTVVYISSAPQWFDWVLAFFNACLLYCSALGVNEIGATATEKRGSGFATTENFFNSWLRKPAAHQSGYVVQG